MRAKISVNLNKIYENSITVQKNCELFGVNVAAVTKMHGASIEICNTLVESGIEIIADSRIENLAKIQNLDCEKWLMRLPSISQCSDVVKLADVSFNSELDTIICLNNHAKQQNKIHNVILMYDLGDLREGYFDIDDLYGAISAILRLSNIRIAGIGTNLSCYGGIMPSEENLTQLAMVAKQTMDEYNIEYKYISGGNSTSYSLIRNQTFPKGEGINNLRIGDTIYLGRDMIERQFITGMHHDSFILQCEIIEVKEKPSIPIGIRGYAALNTQPEFIDRGIRKRAICSVGKQDIDLDIIPTDPNIKVLGASSDHLLLDIHDSEYAYKPGDMLTFSMLYTAIMRGFTSKYIDKEFIYD